jgi:folate-binding protein YgfZ
MTDLSKEYRNVSAAAGWRVASRRAPISLAGRDTAPFLHALVTADVASVPPGGGAYGAYLTPQGRMIADLALYRAADRWLADVPAATAASLAATLDALIFTEDVRVEDQSARIAILSVIGMRAADVLGRLDGVDAGRAAALALRSTLDAPAVSALIARTDASALPSFDLFVLAGQVAGVAARLTAGGAVEMSDDLVEALRIDAGHPSFGRDMDTSTIPLEAGLLDRAISTTKGCYVGQEIIVRVLHRGGGRVARRLMQIAARHDADVIAAGAVIVADGRDAGAVTSAARSPVGGIAIALGYVHRDAATEGRDVIVRSAGADVPAVIVRAAG